MKLPTHIVVDTADGWVFAKDGDGTHFTEHTANHFAAQRNSELVQATYIVAAVTPLSSAEYLAALARDATDGTVAISNTSSKE